jgi:hypothetical protein
MRERALFSILLLIFLAVGITISINTSAYSEEFKATLTVSKIMQPVKTKAKGEATFRLFKGVLC